MACHSAAQKRAKFISERLVDRVIITEKEGKLTDAVLLLIGQAIPCCIHFMGRSVCIDFKKWALNFGQGCCKQDLIIYWVKVEIVILQYRIVIFVNGKHSSLSLCESLYRVVFNCIIGDMMK